MNHNAVISRAVSRTFPNCRIGIDVEETPHATTARFFVKYLGQTRVLVFTHNPEVDSENDLYYEAAATARTLKKFWDGQS